MLSTGARIYLQNAIISILADHAAACRSLQRPQDLLVKSLPRPFSNIRSFVPCSHAFALTKLESSDFRLETHSNHGPISYCFHDKRRRQQIHYLKNLACANHHHQCANHPRFCANHPAQIIR